MLRIFYLSLLASGTAFAGAQQDFFLTAAKGATQVSITRIGPDKNPDGSIRPRRLLVSSDESDIRLAVAAIEMDDPKPTSGTRNEDTGAASKLSSGIPDFCIIFYQGGKILLHYDLDESLTFVAALGPHADQPIKGTIDYPLTKNSTQKIKRLIDRVVKKATQNQSLQPTAPSPRG